MHNLLPLSYIRNVNESPVVVAVVTLIVTADVVADHVGGFTKEGDHTTAAGLLLPVGKLPPPSAALMVIVTGTCVPTSMVSWVDCQGSGWSDDERVIVEFAAVAVSVTPMCSSMCCAHARSGARIFLFSFTLCTRHAIHSGKRP